MILLLSVNEADRLDHQHRRASGITNHQQGGRSAYRASGLVHRPAAAARFLNPSGQFAALLSVAVGQ